MKESWIASRTSVGVGPGVVFIGCQVEGFTPARHLYAIWQFMKPSLNFTQPSRCMPAWGDRCWRKAIPCTWHSVQSNTATFPAAYRCSAGIWDREGPPPCGGKSLRTILTRGGFSEPLALPVSLTTPRHAEKIPYLNPDPARAACRGRSAPRSCRFSSAAGRCLRACR